MVEYVKPRQEYVCTYPRLQDLHRTPWVNLGRPETQEVKSWNTQQLKNFGLLGNQRPKISPLDSVFQFFNDIYYLVVSIPNIWKTTNKHIYIYIYIYINLLRQTWETGPRDDALVLWLLGYECVYVFIYTCLYTYGTPQKEAPKYRLGNCIQK